MATQICRYVGYLTTPLLSFEIRSLGLDVLEFR